MPRVQYKDRVIEAQSYLNACSTPRADADAYAVEIAKRWIDDKGP